MPEISVARLYLLRAGYLLLVVGLGLQIWPGILNPPADLEHLKTAVRSLLGAIAALSLLGLRYPLQMLPLLLFELLWKTIWVVAFGLPRWRAGRLEGAFEETMVACLVSAIFLVLIPWRYVFDHYVRRRGDPWRGPPTRRTAPSSSSPA